MKSRKEYQEQDVVRVLGRWGDRKPSYSVAQQEKRRSAFLSTGLALLGGTGKVIAAGKHAADASMTMGTKIALGILSTAILAVGSYVGVILYTNLISPIDRTPTLTATLPASNEPMPGQVTAFPNGTPTVSATATFVPTVTSISETASAESDPTNSGLHLGQTPHPRPTKKPKP